MNRVRLITRDGRKEIWQGNVLKAYVDPETDWLCILNDRGYVTSRPDLAYSDHEALRIYAENTKRN